MIRLNGTTWSFLYTGADIGGERLEEKETETNEGWLTDCVVSGCPSAAAAAAAAAAMAVLLAPPSPPTLRCRLNPSPRPEEGAAAVGWTLPLRVSTRASAASVPAAAAVVAAAA